MSGNQEEMVELLVEKYKADPTMPATLVCLLLMFSYTLNKELRLGNSGNDSFRSNSGEITLNNDVPLYMHAEWNNPCTYLCSIWLHHTTGAAV